MNKVNYFLLTESYNAVIGVIAATTSEELNTKAAVAINQHFDSDSDETLSLNMEDYFCGDTGEIPITIDNDGETFNQTVFIERVEVY